MGNTPTRGSFVEACSSYDEATINRGTFDQPKPLLKFHSVHGENVQLLNESRIAKRKESFCKGLAFSNRPISVDEIVCLALCEVGTNWSGVLRFGVTNVDPASFRDIELPKFVCPDLTSKAGYWAKALAERYSIDKAILHFFVNANGELHYGINGVNKGLFLNGINVDLPLWIVVDIYGNSVAVEFVDPAEVKLRALNKSLRSGKNQRERPRSTTKIASMPLQMFQDGRQLNGSEEISGSTPTLTEDGAVAADQTMIASTSVSNLNAATDATIVGGNHFVSARTSPFTQQTVASPMRFHMVKGANVSLEGDDFVAVRQHGEYSLGYVFTERPINVDEIISIIVLQCEQAFSGSLAFGVTSCDPVQVAASRLPADSDDLLERPEYWVCIKDVAAQPSVGDRLSFRVDSLGKVFFAKNDAIPRVIMHVDISVKLWLFFDLYGSTGKIQLIDTSHQQFSNYVASAATENTRNHRASSEGAFATSAALAPNAISMVEHMSTGALAAMDQALSSGGAAFTTPLQSSSIINSGIRPVNSGQFGNTAALYLEHLRVALPPTTTTESTGDLSTRLPDFLSLGGGPSSSEENLRNLTRSIPISTSAAVATSSSSTSSSASSSAPMGIASNTDELRRNNAAELARLRASITRRSNTAYISPSTSTTTSFRNATATTTTSTETGALLDPHRSTFGGGLISSTSSPFMTTTNNTIGDDFDVMAARYSTLLSSRRRGQGPSYSASPSRRDDFSSTTTTTLASTPPTTSSYGTPSATPITSRGVLTEALECLNNAANTNSGTMNSLFNAFTSSCTIGSSGFKGTEQQRSLAAPKFVSTSSSVTESVDVFAESSAGGTECSICMNNRVNAVIYRCGHMCMCFTCAKELNRRSGDCPICRTPIIDVIRCYPA